MAATYVVRLSDPDPWWHLATGRWIVEHRAIPHVDPFSFTVAGAPWRAVDWLADLAMYGSCALGGDAGLGVLTALSAFAMLALLGLTLRELELSTATAASVVVCVGVMVQGRYSMARPMMLGAVALCATLYLCTRTWQRAWLRRPRAIAASSSPRRWCVVWTALHSTPILGLVIVAIFALAALVVRHPAARLRRRAALAIALAAAAVGARALRRGAGARRSPLAVALTPEWAPRASAIASCGSGARRARRRRRRPRRARDAGARRLSSAASRSAPSSPRASRATCTRRSCWPRRWPRSPSSAPTPGSARNGAPRRSSSRSSSGWWCPRCTYAWRPRAFNPRFGVGPDDGAVPTETLAALRARCPPAAS